MNYKFKIYMLVLLSFSFLCCNALLDNLYESMQNAQEVLKDVASSVNLGLKTLGQTIKYLEQFIDSTVEEDCIYICPNKNEVPVNNPSHVTEVNGCGSLGLHLEDKDLPRPEMVECCNGHDRCYDICAADKEDCDKKFKRCLYNVCDLNKQNTDKLRHKMCQGGAKLLYTATLALGCSSFKDAQSEACICQPVQKENPDFKKREL